MREVFLLAAVGAVFAYGMILMKKLDALLAGREVREPEKDHHLRIGFSDPQAAAGLSDALAAYARAKPGLSLSLLRESGDDLVEALSTNELDLVFLPQSFAVPPHYRFQVQNVSLPHLQTSPKNTSHPHRLPQKAALLKTTKTTQDFIACLQAKLPIAN